MVEKASSNSWLEHARELSSSSPSSPEEDWLGHVRREISPYGEWKTEQGVKSGKIERPFYSRPLDVHRWSEHPELVDLTETLWNRYCSGLDRSAKGGPKPKRPFRQQLRILLLDLYVAWLEDPQLSIGVAMSESSWNAWSRYNKLGISKKIIEIVHLLHGKGLLELAKGSYSGPGVPSNRTTRIRAAAPLQEMFRTVNAGRDDVVQAREQECIVLKQGEGENARTIEYEDSEDTNRMREALQAYNALIARSFIDVTSLEEPRVIRKDGRGEEKRVPVDRHHQFTRRIFSRGSWMKNGRFYGPWWQQISGEDRKRIVIDDVPTVEVDFQGLHLAIIAAQQGVEIAGDPYELPEGSVPGQTAEAQRRIVKKLVLTALNARTEKAAFNSFREGWETGHPGKHLTNAALTRLLSLFSRKNPWAEPSLGKDQGIGLMYLDSQIAERVLSHFTGQGVPVLCIHDSFIIEHGRVQELKAVMARASREVVGKALPVSASGLGLDEFRATHPAYMVQDFIAYANRGRCKGYRKRLEAWREKEGGGG